ncbi:MAG: hypothetical protein ACI9WS_003142 [Paraglaciecola psychrophila]
MLNYKNPRPHRKTRRSIACVEHYAATDGGLPQPMTVLKCSSADGTRAFLAVSEAQSLFAGRHNTTNNKGILAQG